jgi:hypothetical protein
MEEFSVVSSFVGEGFLWVLLFWKKLAIECVVVNIYSPCDLHKKRLLWKELLELKTRLSQVEFWCLLGDFNAFAERNERKGASANQRGVELREFKRFLDEIDLVDLPI